ncbi:MAG: class I SAM-dependent methyltransferase [Azonexus sp.]
MSLNFTGERFVPGVGGGIEAEHLHRYLLARELVSGRDVLDAACGEGYGSSLLAGVARSVVGVDISDSAVRHAREKYRARNLRFVEGDCSRLPLESTSVDMVVSFETIEHHSQHDAMLREFKRVLRPGGTLFISSPNRPEYDKTLVTPNPYHVKELDFDEFFSLLSAHFKNVSVYAQRVVAGSLVVPYEHPESGFTSLSETNAYPWQGLVRPIYFVAVASDGDLQPLGASIHESANDAQSQYTHTFSEARVYISERVEGIVQAYGEARGAAQLYALDGERTAIDLVLPDDLMSLARLRLDIANAPVAIRLHGLALHKSNGDEIWRWDGGCDLFANSSGVLCIPGDSGATLLCLNDDPQFDISVPAAILALVQAGALLRLDLTAKPLLDALPGVLFDIRSTERHALPALARTHLPAGLGGHLEELAGLLKTQIGRKNATISVQQAEIENLRARQQVVYEQLIRAEAQLELLKEIALSETRGHLESL